MICVEFLTDGTFEIPHKMFYQYIENLDFVYKWKFERS